MKKKLKVIGISVLSVVLALLLTVSGYLGYLLIDYNRLPDNIVLSVEEGSEGGIRCGEEISIVSYNIGFGAYEPDFGFFMDGGERAWAWTEERLTKNLENIEALLKQENADFILLQEADENATRSYHFNERAFFTEAFSDYDTVWGQNWDSSFLFYPFHQPHGKALAGMLTFSKGQIAGAIRKSLPVETGLTKIADLDRCYTRSTVEIENSDKQLILYNVHLSAYTSDGKIAVEQLKILIEDMQSEYEKGNYVVGGGDFNKDLLGDSSEYFGVSGEDYVWAQPFPTELLGDSNLSLHAGLNEEDPVPSCRNADGPYTETQFVLTVDGFIVSDNVKVEQAEVMDTGFAHSDHNPVRMTFILE